MHLTQKLDISIRLIYDVKNDEWHIYFHFIGQKKSVKSSLFSVLEKHRNFFRILRK